MTLGWKYSRPIKERLLTLEEPGKPSPLEADRSPYSVLAPMTGADEQSKIFSYPKLGVKK